MEKNINNEENIKSENDNESLIDVIKNLDENKKQEVQKLVKEYISDEDKFKRAKEYMKFKQKQKIAGFFKKIFQGLLILTPFIVIGVIFWQGVELLGFIIDILLKILFLNEIFDEGFMVYLKFGLGIILIGLIGYGSYYLSKIYIGKWLYNKLELYTAKLPIIGTVYKVIKDFLKLFDGDAKKKGKFGIIVLIEYPKEDSYVLGIVNVTKDTLLKDVVSVYVPTAPNPTNGYNVLVAKKEVKIVNVSMEDLMKYTISCGTVEIESFLIAGETFETMKTLNDLKDEEILA